MTITVTGVKSKKELKEAAQFASLKHQVFFKDESIFNPLNGGALFTLHEASVMFKGQEFLCTNHPKRSWFAKVEIDQAGKVKVS